MFPTHRVTWSPATRRTRVIDTISGRERAAPLEVGALLHSKNGAVINGRDLSDPERELLTDVFGADRLEAGVRAAVTQVTRTPQLSRLQIELTRRCNLRCSYCYNASGPKVTETLDFELAQQILTDAADLGCIHLDVTGGEPLLHPKWKELLRHARELGFVMTLHTNGVSVKRTAVELLAEIGLRIVQLSADSHLPELHDRIRGRNGALNATIQAQKSLREAGLHTRIALMAHRHNLHTLPEAVAWFRGELGVSVIIDRIVHVGKEVDARTGVTAAEFYEAVVPILDKDGVSRICGESDTIGSVVEPHCGIGHSFVYVTSAAEAAICPTMTSRDKPIFSGPNLREVSLSDAWYDSPYFAQYRLLNCENTSVCPAASQCGGGCRSNAYLEWGALDSPDLVSCNVHKNPEPTFTDFSVQYRRRQSLRVLS
ncbi:MAG: radical SAM protein [Myxococcota bacterium]